MKSGDKDEYINTTIAWIISCFKLWWMMRSLVLVGFLTGVKFEVTSGFDRKWTPNVVPVEENWVEEGISGFKVWWMMRSLVLVYFSWGQFWGYFRF